MSDPRQLRTLLARLVKTAGVVDTIAREAASRGERYQAFVRKYEPLMVDIVHDVLVHMVGKKALPIAAKLQTALEAGPDSTADPVLLDLMTIAGRIFGCRVASEYYDLYPKDMPV